MKQYHYAKDGEAVARAHLAPYKLPRRFMFLERILRAPSGKADYSWARETALKGST